MRPVVPPEVGPPAAERPVWFGPTDRPLFGWVHHPADGIARGAVVLCPPLAREWTNAHYCYRLVAQHLAASGMLAVRFDYDGTGDSAGGDHDPDRVAAWVASIEHAVTFTRQAGCSTVSLVGMRIGALLAAAAADRVGPLDAVVLWDPCSSARAFVREQAALQRMVLDGPPRSESAIELPGAVLSEKTVADLTALSVSAPRRPPGRVLLVARPNRRVNTELVDSLGTPAELLEARGQDRLLEVDLADREMPVRTMRDIVAWLADVPAPPEKVSPVGRDRADLRSDASVVTERVVALGPLPLFGILTEPEAPSDGPTVLFLNSGNNSHVGPSRLWVDLARRWAGLGLRCVRMDESGLGDSPNRVGQTPQAVRVPENFDDLEDARLAVEPDDPTNVVLVGLCTGGYQALESALARPARAVYAINPVLHFAPPELAVGPIDPRRRICWPTGGIVEVYRRLAIEPVRRRLRRVAWGVARLAHPGRNRGGWLEQLRADGVDVLILCGEDEARSLAASGAAPSEFSEPGGAIRIELVPGLDHALVPAWQRADVTARLTERLLARHLGTPRAVPDEREPVASTGRHVS
jgi:alpha-beta hydrolase superfamily lysophospholipase